MPAKIKYNDNIIASVFPGQTATVNIKGSLPQSHLVVDLSEMHNDTAVSVLQEKIITENGEYMPDDGYDGLSKVVVKVPGEVVEIYDGGVIISGGTASLISFTIDGTEYQAEDGMTWEEWLESAYNTANYSYLLLEGVDTVLLESVNSVYHYGLSYNDAFVPITDTVVADRAYTKKRGTHSGGSN